jgi:hypothetical protein
MLCLRVNLDFFTESTIVPRGAVRISQLTGGLLDQLTYFDHFELDSALRQ